MPSGRLRHVPLQQYMSDNIETIQKRALSCIMGGTSYVEILSNVGRGLPFLPKECQGRMPMTWVKYDI